MLEQFKFYILPSVISFIGITFIQYKILDRKIGLKNVRLYIAFLIFILLNIFVYIFIDGFLKMLCNTFLIIFISYIIFKDNINKIFVTVLLEQILYFFSELIIAVILLLFDIDREVISQNLIYFSILNIGISLCAIMLYYIPLIKRLIEKIVVFFNNIIGMKKYLITIIFLVTISILLMLIYVIENNKYIIIINTIFILIYSIILYYLANEKNENIKFKQENEMLLGNLNEYEKMLDYQRVSNHENKNQLLVIRSMISKNNKKALDYLDEIITEKRKDDEGLYTYAKIIPEGGLQGLVYQKMLKMKENNIKINLNVDRKIRKVNFDSISSKVNYDLCRAVGIILDNAIEEVIKLKEKEVLVCMYKDEDYFVIEVSNKCEIIPDLSMMDEKGYTTKSEGHGYGLSLLKEIVSNNKSIINERKIDKDIFTQIIKIKGAVMK